MKRFISILLLAAMLLLTAGCGQTPSDPESTSETEAETIPAPETSEEPAESEEEPVAEPRMRDDYLYIGVHHLHSYARTEQHIRDLADSGADYVLEIDRNSRRTFDLFKKYGIGVVVVNAVPKWGGGGYGFLGRMEEKFPKSVYRNSVRSFRDHPAIWGIYFADEPSALDFEYMGEMVDLVDKGCPEQFVYVNLYPNYASTANTPENEVKSQLGTQSYQEYIDEYCRYFPLDYISFDFYPYSDQMRHAKTDPNDGVSLFYENLRIVSEACRNTGRNLWFIGQVNSIRRKVFTSTNQIRFQAFTAMAFGAVNIQWGCYTAGWWHNQILDENGNKTEQYDKMKTVNWEIHTIAEEYMKYRNTATHFVGFTADSPEMKFLNQEPMESLNTGIFFDVKADNGAPLVIGQMVSRTDDGSYALMICASDDSSDLGTESYHVVFRVNNRSVQAIGGNGELPVTQLEDGSYSVPISSNKGILITAR